MSFSWDWNLATLVAIGIQIVVFIAYLIKTNGKAHSAYDLAFEAKRIADEAHEKIGVAQGSIALVREQYVDKDSLRDMEARLTTAINKVGDRLDQFLKLAPK